MDVTEVAHGVFRVLGSRTNFALVVDGDEVTAIDTGWRGDRELFEAALSRIGRRLGDLRAVLLTHGHVDHMGSAAHLRRTQRVPVMTLADEVPNVRGERHESATTLDLALRIWQPGMIGFAINALRSGGPRVEHPDEVTGITDGETLDVPGRPTAVATPGHTSGHTAFHLAERGVLLTGDSLCTHDLVTGEPGPQLAPPVFNLDHDRAIASLERYRPLEAEAIIPGHGEPWFGSPADAVVEALRRVER